MRGLSLARRTACFLCHSFSDQACTCALHRSPRGGNQVWWTPAPKGTPLSRPAPPQSPRGGRFSPERRSRLGAGHWGEGTGPSPAVPTRRAGETPTSRPPLPPLRPRTHRDSRVCVPPPSRPPAPRKVPGYHYSERPLQDSCCAFPVRPAAVEPESLASQSPVRGR